MDDAKPIFLAETGLYEIMKMERLLLAAAESFKITDIESSFNEIVDRAVNDYSAFSSSVAFNPTQLEIDLLTNFNEFFELIIDIKKKEEDEKLAVAAATADDNTSTTTAVIVSEQQLPKSSKRSRNGN